MPDIVIKQEKLPNILFYLVRDNLIFDYATQYCLKHPTIVAPEKFEVTDADYNDFKALVKKADFKYDQQSEKILKTLKEAAVTEKAKYHFDAQLCTSLDEAVQLAHANTRRGLLVCGSEAAALEAAALLAKA